MLKPCKGNCGAPINIDLKDDSWCYIILENEDVDYWHRSCLEPLIEIEVRAV